MNAVIQTRAIFHLFCLAAALLIVFTAMQFMEIPALNALGSLLVFYYAFYQFLDLLAIPEKIIKKTLEDYYAGLKKEMQETFQRIKRRQAYQEAFDTPEEKAKKEKKLQIIEEKKQFIQDLDKAKETYPYKKETEMNDFEKYHLYDQKVRKFNKLAAIPSLLILFIVGAVILSVIYVSSVLLMLVLSPGLLAYFILYMLLKKNQVKLTELKQKIFPPSLKQEGEY